MQKSKPVTVGIMGVNSGAGVTTLAVSLAGYLSAFHRKSVAVVECGQKSEFRLMRTADDMDIFTIKNIDYYCKKAADISDILKRGYDAIIMDYGSGTARLDQIRECTHKVVVASLEPWNVDRYDTFCESMKEWFHRDTWLHILHGDIGELRRVTRAYGVQPIKRPFIENVHIVDRDLVKFFQSLF